MGGLPRDTRRVTTIGHVDELPFEFDVRAVKGQLQVAADDGVAWIGPLTIVSTSGAGVALSAIASDIATLHI